MSRQGLSASQDPCVALLLGHHRRVDECRSRLVEVVDSCRDTYGATAVRKILEEVLATLGEDPTSVQPLKPLVAVLGLSDCATGWVGVLIRPSGQTTLHVGSALAALVEQVREQEQLALISLCVASRRDEAKAWLLSRPTVEVMEAIAPAGTPSEQRQALAAAGLTTPVMYSGMGFVVAELLVSCFAALEAARRCS